ncbi:C39 family peptidase, partial [Planctomycetota bacterium]|nr:C39 family peptidase [Planctomycetota bacterium]
MDTALPTPPLAEISELYESARFMDVWRLTQACWQDNSFPQRLSVEELVMAARTAVRLGNSRWCRALLRVAVERQPDSLLVRYYGGAVVRRSASLFDTLRDLEDNTPDHFDDPTLESSWRSSHAVALAHVRDFERAHEELNRALDCGRGDGYVFCNQSRVLLIEDRWEEALAAAQASWNGSPGHPYSADALHQSLSALGRDREALDFLLEHIRSGGQSGDCLATALSASYAIAERMDEDERTPFLAEMMQESLRLEELFPLADRHTLRAANHTRLLIAFQARDWDQLRKLQPAADSPFFNKLTKNLAESPNGRRKLIPHKPIRQRHNTCLPASLAIVAGASGVEIDQDTVAAAISFEGTVHWRARDFGHENGLVVRSFRFDVATAKALIDRGIGFLISFTYLNSGHACAFVGYDDAIGTALIHDPAIGRIREMLIDRVADGEAPLGPFCMLFLTKEQAEQVADLKLPGEREEADVHEVFRAHAIHGSSAAQKLAVEMKGDSPQVRFMQALANSLAGEYGQSTEAFLSLLREFPECVRLQRQVLSSVGALGDSTRVRKTLHKIVTRAPLPGVEGSRDWIYPEAHLLSRYASELMQNAKLHKEAHRWLKRALRRGPSDGEIYFEFGNLMLTQGKPEAANLPLRFAASLDSGNEHTTDVYTTELHKQGRTQDAISWLRSRIEKYGEGVGGSGPWITFVTQLEYFGRPQEALSELRKAREARPNDGELASFATSFFGHYGRDDEADTALQDAKTHGRSADKHLATVKRFIAKAQLEEALETAKLWHLEAPRDRNSCNQVLRLTESLHGPEASLVLAEKWHQQSPRHDMFEELLLAQLSGSSRSAEREPLLKARVKRNPHDAWAWRQLAIVLEATAAKSKGEHQTRKL